MTQFFAYRDAFGASDTFIIPLDPDVIRLGELEGLTEMAEHLQAGTTTLTFDDPDADLGNAGDAILAQARIRISETAAAVGAQRLYSGIIGARTYKRGSFITGASRVIEIELHDLNALMSFRIIPNTDRDAIRPAETVTDRMAWIMSTDYMGGVIDDGAVDANSTQMTANDYRGQRPANVVNDCELAAGFGWNAFVRFWDEAATNPDLVFHNANTSTDLTSTLRISNDLSDLDDFTDPAAITFGPSVDAELRRDPTNLASGVYLPYKNSAVYVESAATVAAYGHKDITAPNSNVSTKARATAAATDLTFQHATEEDRITVTVELPPSHVNLIRQGMRMQVKFTHLPGYEFFTWCRVLSRSPAQTKQTDDRYWMRLELSPQEEPCTETIEDYPFTGSMSGGNTGAGAQTPGNLANCIDGNVLTYTEFHSGGAGGANPESWAYIDLGAPVELFKIITLSAGSGWALEDFVNGTAAPQYAYFKWSSDASSWTTISVTKTADDGNSPAREEWTFDDGPITARYWMLLRGGKKINNVWEGFNLYEWGGTSLDCG